ncbi:MAG: GDP-mannose 4,6-dehydratase [bacterium]
MFEKLVGIGYAFSAERSTRLNALLRWQWEYTPADRFETIEGLYRADGQLFWDNLAKIEPLGEQPVYDIEVESETHLFVAGGIQVSNCIYGPHQFGIEDQGWVAYFTIQNELEKPVTIYGDGKQVRDVLFVGDLIRAFELATEKIEIAQGQIYNIGGGPQNTLSLLELVDFLENMTGKKMQYTFSDWRPGDQRVYISDIRKAKKDLDWAPKVPIHEGLTILYEWVKGNKDVLLHLTEKQTSVKSTPLFQSVMSKNFKKVAKTQALKEVKNFPALH